MTCKIYTQLWSVVGQILDQKVRGRGDKISKRMHRMQYYYRVVCVCVCGTLSDR